ncbi:MAG: class C sortase [Ruminococcaceae bacterium]|nr:class C sortase [Oscillospiraceae bacterium]
MKKHWSTIILILALLVGLSLLLYPTISDYWNSLHQSKAIASYVDQISKLDEDAYNKILDDARDFNSKRTRDTFTLTESERSRYKELLNPGGLGIMSYIEIPSIGVSLPIYHGTSESVLQKYVGHLEWSSLPVGGENTHCIISGHRGLPSATLFTNLDKMVEGDTFVIRTLNEVLTYEVEAVHIVEPDDFQYLKIEKGKDLCTLLTCTPYGVNSHRLLVRAHRIENIEEGSVAHVTADAMQIEPLVMAPILAIPIFTVVLIFIFAFNKKKRD